MTKIQKFIRVEKGLCDDIEIIKTDFPLLEDVRNEKGCILATVDASKALGDSYKKVTMQVFDYHEWC